MNIGRPLNVEKGDVSMGRSILSGQFRIADREGFEKRLARLESVRDPRACFYRAMKATGDYEQYELLVGPLKATPVTRKDGPFTGRAEIEYARKTGWIADLGTARTPIVQTTSQQQRGSRAAKADYAVEGIRSRSLETVPSFGRYIGIDYSGARTPIASLPGLRMYLAQGDALPVEVPAPPSARKYWTRRGIAEWLVQRLAERTPTLVGIDHAFSFPRKYFELHRLVSDWPAFLDDFQRHWPTDEDHAYVDFVREGLVGNGGARSGNSRWRRLAEERAGGAKSVFHFDVQGSVAKSSHAGIPWLRFIRQQVGDGVQFWPFDGWDLSEGQSAVVEVYPSLWSRGFPREGRNPHQHDAYSVAAWMQQADRDGSLRRHLSPALSSQEKAVAGVEGWILGVA